MELNLCKRIAIPIGKGLFGHFINFMVNAIILIACSNRAYSQNLQIAESPVSLHELYTEANIVKSKGQRMQNNFYKTDSIFSFRSSKGYFPSLIHNFEEQAKAPLHFKTKQWLMTGAVVGITIGLIIIDNDIDDWARVQKQEHNWINKSSPFITEFGGNYGLYSVAAVGLASAAFKDNKGVQTSLLATQAMITSGVWVRLLKMLFSRERPSAAYIYSKSEGGYWYGPFTQYDQDFLPKRGVASFDAFPSGHTATAFSIATVFALQYKNRPVIPVISYSAATLVGISRLIEHEHWSSDVFLGAIIGYVCGKQVVLHYNKSHQNALTSTHSKSKNKIELTFIQYGNQVGLSLKW